MDPIKMTFGSLVPYLLKDLEQMYDSREIPSLLYLMAENRWGMSKGQLLLQREDDLSQNQINDLENILSELKLGTPIQYILGCAWFYDYQFRVNPNVLIPRPETEELLAWALGAWGNEGSGKWGMGEAGDGEPEKRRRIRILDIGTGSGCIAITLKLKIPDADVWAMDVSLPALETARYNAESLGAEIKFILGDILAWDKSNLGDFDIIISNPPYITTNEKMLMRANVLEFEPEMALFVHDDDPLIFYNAIADFSKKYLARSGKLFFEINEAFGKDMIALLKNKGFTDIMLNQDIHGKDRMISALQR
ncbi:MAG: peptide chain release factor N(5)-glutamine methyltransferase [Bacteroidota bacterium]